MVRLQCNKLTYQCTYGSVTEVQLLKDIDMKRVFLCITVLYVIKTLILGILKC